MTETAISVKSDPAGLVEYIASNLVNNPKEVQVNPVIGQQAMVVELRVDQSDLGTVIGKGGRIAKAVRTLLNSISVRKIVHEDGSVESYNKINLEIIDE